MISCSRSIVPKQWGTRKSRNGEIIKGRFVKLIAVPAILFFPSLCFGVDVGITSIQVMTGYVSSPAVFGTSSRPDLNYVMTNVRVEWMRFVKNFRMLAEATYSETTTGPSGYLVGGTLLLRYDFGPIRRFTPYAQVGAGILYNDLYRDHSQDLVGNEIEFNSQTSFGFRYAIHPKLSLDIEGIFHHVSNAGLEDRNDGINGIGCLLGVTYYWE